MSKIVLLTSRFVFLALVLASGTRAWLHAAEQSVERGSGKAAASKAAKSKTEAGTPADNSLCYVCHLSLQAEEITKVHQAAGTGCSQCHGASAEHMHDEMLMTPPDQKFGRAEVDRMCGVCHESPHEEKKREVDAFLKKWQGRDRPNGRVITPRSVCTDCHGEHNLKKDKGKSKVAESGTWVRLFNARDLTGWKAAGAAEWQVKRGRIVGTLGPNRSGGDLWWHAACGDTLLSVTFRSEGDVRGGIWLGGRPGSAQGSKPAGNPLRLEILSCRQPPAYTGSLRAADGGWLLVNRRNDLVDEEGWNTLSAEIRGRSIQVWLNGEEIGRVRVAEEIRGHLGLNLEGTRPSAEGVFEIREMQMQPLAR